MSVRLVASSIRLFVLTAALSLCFSLFAPPALAQSTFERGYIVTAAGDTTRGLIENLNWQRAPRSVRFTEQEGESPTTLRVTDIAGFGVGGYAFERRMLKVDQRPVDLSIQSRNSMAVKRDTLFLQRIVEGQMKLYSSYTTRPHYFIETEAHGLEELIYFVREYENEGRTRMRRATFFRQQLRSRRSEECANASVSRLDYERDDLVEFVESCNPQSQVLLPSVSGPRFQFSHVLGLRASRIESRHPLVTYPGEFTGFSPGFQYQVQMEPTERYATTAFLLGVGLQRMMGSRPPETTKLIGEQAGEIRATVLEISIETRFRFREANWRPFGSLELAALHPLTYEGEIKFSAQEWKGPQVGAGVGFGVEGPQLGSRLGVFYGTSDRRVGSTPPSLLEFEVQVFYKL